MASQQDQKGAPAWGEAQKYDYNGFSQNSFDHSAKIYQWDGDEGTLGPRDEQLEEELFGAKDAREMPAGLDFTKIKEIRLEQEGPERIHPAANFAEAGLHPALLQTVDLMSLKVPTPIQMYCLPAISQGYDVIATAQTGSGKTIAYLLPILNKLIGKFKKLAAPRPSLRECRDDPSMFARAEPLVLIVVPTRELAIQIFNVARKLCYRTMLRPSIVYGGASIAEQLNNLAKGCDILIGVPGRLLDFMDRPERLTLRRLKYIVIDEADEMLHDDWQKELPRILSGGEQDEGNIQYMLFSATFPKQLRELASQHLAENHIRFRVGRAGSTTENIRQVIVDVSPNIKRQKLQEILTSMPPARTIIFVNSKRSADELDDFLYNQGMPCTSLHSDRTQHEREDALRAFRMGKSPILVATGVMARGIDVKNVMHVINYDMPQAEYGGIEEYTHRIGRTGRIGHKGLATSFYTDRDEPIASVLVRTMLETKQEIPDFLQMYQPEDKTNLKFEAEGEFEEGGMGGIDNAAPDAWDATDVAASGGSGNAGTFDAGGNNNGGGSADAWGNGTAATAAAPTNSTQMSSWNAPAAAPQAPVAW